MAACTHLLPAASKFSTNKARRQLAAALAVVVTAETLKSRRKKVFCGFSIVWLTSVFVPVLGAVYAASGAIVPLI
jgi:hypothetical protein